MTRLAYLAALAVPCVCSCRTGPSLAMTTVSQDPWGEVDGRQVSTYALVNDSGVGVRITDYGAVVTHLQTRDRDGRFDDVVPGFGSLDDYVRRSPRPGGVGGARRFDRVVWDSRIVETSEGLALQLSYESPDGEQGHPGNVRAELLYRLTDADELVVELTATTDRKTPVDLVHRSRWNLAGHDSGSVLDHQVAVHTDFDAPPSGDTASRVYDASYVVEGDAGVLRPVAWVHDPGSGRTMGIHSDQPGVRLDTGASLDGLRGKDGARYGEHAGLAVGSQVLPYAARPEGEDGWPPVVLRPDETYRHTMVYRFGTAERSAGPVKGSLDDIVGSGSIDIFPGFKPVVLPPIDIWPDGPPGPGGTPPTATEPITLTLRKVHCYDVNDAGTHGHKDHIKLRRYWGFEQSYDLDLNHYKNGTSRWFQEEVYPNFQNAVTFVLVEIDGWPNGDDRIGSFRLELAPLRLVPQSNTTVWKNPPNQRPGTWAVRMKDSGGDYQLIFELYPPVQ